LLPVARTVAGSRDATILDNARATIIRRDEMDTPEAAEMVKGAPAVEPEDLTSADTPGEALSNVGKAFLGNLMGKTTPPVSAAVSAAADTTTTGTSVAGDPGAPAGANEAELRQVLTEYSTALAARQYTKLAAFCSSSLRSEATRYFNTLDEMNTSLTSLLAAYEKSTPGVKTKFEQKLSQKATGRTVNGINIKADDSGRPGAEVSMTEADAVPLVILMVHEDEGWRISSTAFADSSILSKLIDDMDAHVESLDDEVDELTGGGTADSSRLDKLIDDAINYLTVMPN
jgi:hypothetical protein